MTGLIQQHKHMDPSGPSCQCFNNSLMSYLYPGHTVDPLWSKDCRRVILVGRQVRGRATGWSSCWIGRGLRESGCPRCGCCCCAAGEGRVPAARQEPPRTAEYDRRQTAGKKNRILIRAETKRVKTRVTISNTQVY